MAAARRSHVGNVSLALAVGGAAGAHAALAFVSPARAPWLLVLGAGFEAAIVGGLADWFAVTALFRHPFGIPIPHTAIIPARRAKIIESIVTMVEEEWLSPEIIGQRLARLSPSAAIVEWLHDPAHVERLGAPVRDVLRGVARMLTSEEATGFVDRAVQRQLRDLAGQAEGGGWLARVARSDAAGAAFTTLATSLANLAGRPATAAQLQWWLDRSAETLRHGGRRFVPFVLRRKIVQERIVEAACDYAAAELRAAAADADHPLRRLVLGGLGRFADRLAARDPDALAQAERLRDAVLESLEAGPFLRDGLARLQDQLEHELDDPGSTLSTLVDRELREGITDLLDDPARRATFDEWVRTTAQSLLRRHHHQIGITVRESLEALETGELVAQIEDRVGADLQFIRLNGAVVGGLVGLGIAALRWAMG